MGRSFSHLSETFSIKKKYGMYLTAVRQKERERKRRDFNREKNLLKLKLQNITDEKVIEKELDLIEF